MVKACKQSVEFLDTKEDWDRGLARIARCTRVAYRSDNPGKTEAEARKRDEALLGRLLFRNGVESGPRHTSTTEHVVWGVILHCSRAIANEFVRHRHTAYTQESTRYVNFNKKDAEFVVSSGMPKECMQPLLDTYDVAYANYLKLLDSGVLPQMARDALPLGLATTMAMSTNIAEWRRIFELRCDKGAHPDARSIAWTILTVFNRNAPWAFSDLFEKFKGCNIPLCDFTEP